MAAVKHGTIGYTCPVLDAFARSCYRAAYCALRLWWFVRRPHVHGAFVAVWFEGALLLIRNSYRGGETIPCGRVESGETARAAARRELLEEVGIDAPEHELGLALEFELWFEHKHDRATIFEWHPPGRPVIRVDAREVVWGQFVPESELQARPLAPHVIRYLAWRRARNGCDGTEPGPLSAAPRGPDPTR